MNKQYDDLPDAIKAVYSEAEWLFLSSSQKRNLVQTETEPEVE